MTAKERGRFLKSVNIFFKGNGGNTYIVHLTVDCATVATFSRQAAQLGLLHRIG